MELIKNPRFVSEYKEFKDKIDRVENEKIKNDLTDLLKKLVAQVKELDFRHKELTSISKNPQDLSESKNNLLKIRKELHRKLEDYQKLNS